MAYKANIPQPTDQISISQDDILKNFQAINTFVGVDHYGFGTGSDEGRHLFNQGTAPTVASATQVGIYAKDLGGKPELYINKAADAGAVTQIPFTKSLKTNPGWTYLPSGIILQWTSGSMGDHVVSENVVLPIAFPKANLCCIVSPNSLPWGVIEDAIIVGYVNGLQSVIVERKATRWTGISYNILAIGH